MFFILRNVFYGSLLLPSPISGPFGYNEKAELRVEFSLPITPPEANDLPVLSMVVGSTSTARTFTYLTASALYATEVSAVNTSQYSDTSLFFTYLVGPDDESDDLR